jgi:hypothetical protein
MSGLPGVGLSSLRDRSLFIALGLLAMGSLMSTAAQAKQYQYKVCFVDDGKYTFDVKNCDPTKVGSIIRSDPLPRAVAVSNPTKTKIVRLSSIASSPSVAKDGGKGPQDSKACPNGFFSHLVIGDSFTDLNFLDTANCNAALAKGAQFSWSRDAVAANSQWLAKGVVAEKFVWLNEPAGLPTGPYVNLFAVAPFVNFQRVINTNAKVGATQNVDVLSYGFSSEALIAGVRDPLQNSWQVYLRSRASANGDWEGHTNSWSTTFELQPVSDLPLFGRSNPVGSFGYFFIYPLLRAQYFQRVNSSTDPIFSRGNDVFRAGPAVSLSLIPQPTGDFDPNKPRPAPQWILNLIYSWYHDFLHGQEFQHWNPSLTYNITDNIGFSVGYERGRIETTGKNVNLTTVSLTVKN